MAISKPAAASLEAAVETWSQIANDCKVFNQGTELETAGHVARSVLTFGTSSLMSLPNIDRNIENQKNRLEEKLYDFKRRVLRVIDLIDGDINIYEEMIDVERLKYGRNLTLECGYLKSGDSYEPYECNVGEVAFHLIHAKSFWNSGDHVSNSVQDIGNRFRMVCRKRRRRDTYKRTPRLESMPHTPIAERLRSGISERVHKGSGAVYSAIKDGLSRFSEDNPEVAQAFKESSLNDLLKSKDFKDKLKNGLIDFGKENTRQ